MSRMNHLIGCFHVEGKISYSCHIAFLDLRETLQCQFPLLRSNNFYFSITPHVNEIMPLIDLCHFLSKVVSTLSVPS